MTTSSGPRQDHRYSPPGHARSGGLGREEADQLPPLFRRIHGIAALHSISRLCPPLVPLTTCQWNVWQRLHGTQSRIPSTIALFLHAGHAVEKGSARALSSAVSASLYARPITHPQVVHRVAKNQKRNQDA